MFHESATYICPLVVLPDIADTWQIQQLRTVLSADARVSIEWATFLCSGCSHCKLSGSPFVCCFDKPVYIYCTYIYICMYIL